MLGDFLVIISENLTENICKQDVLKVLEKIFTEESSSVIIVLISVEQYIYPVICLIDFVSKEIWVYKHKDSSVCIQKFEEKINIRCN